MNTNSIKGGNVKVVTFRASSIGDSLMGKYFLENIRAYHPNAKCFLVVGSRGEMIKNLFINYPWIIVREVNRKNPLSVLSLIIDTWGANYTATQYTKGTFSLASKIVARLITRSGSLVGWNDKFKFNHYIFDVLLNIGEKDSVVDLEKKVLKAFSIPIAHPNPVFLPKQDNNFRDLENRFQIKSKFYVIVHLYSGNDGRGLTEERKKDLVESLLLALPNEISIIITGGKDNVASARNLIISNRVKIVAGDTSIQETVSLIMNSLFVVSVDTGIAHIAAQAGVELIVLRSCIGKKWWLDTQYMPGKLIHVYEHDSSCSNGHVYGSYPVCMNSIDIGNIVGKAIEICKRSHPL